MKIIDFRHELAVLVVRSTIGEVVAYPAVETGNGTDAATRHSRPRRRRPLR